MKRDDLTPLGQQIMCRMRSCRCPCGYMCGWADGVQVVFCGCPVQLTLW